MLKYILEQFTITQINLILYKLLILNKNKIKNTPLFELLDIFIIIENI